MLLATIALPACGRFGYDASAGDGGAGDGGTASLVDCDPSDAIVVRASTIGGSAERPQLVARGRSVGVVWTDRRSAVHQLYYLPIASTGELGAEVNLTNNAEFSYYPSVLFDGTNLAVAWTAEDSGGIDRVDFARFDVQGNRLGQVTTLVTFSGGAWWPILAWTGAEYAMVWADDSAAGFYNAFFARVDAGGLPLGSVEKLTADLGNAWAPTLVFDGTGYTVVYEESDGQAQQLFVQRLDAMGTPQGSPRQLTTGTVDVSEPSLAWNGSQYALVWYTEAEEVRFLALDGDGVPVGSEVLLATGAYHPEAAWSGTAFAVTWIDGRDGTPRAYASIVDETGSLQGEPVVVSAAGVEASNPDVVWAQDRWAFAWSTQGTTGEEEEISVVVGCQ